MFDWCLNTPLCCKVCNYGCKWDKKDTLPVFTCFKLTIETVEQGVKYVETYFTPCCSISIVNFE